MAACIRAADPWAGVAAVLGDAGLVGRTLCVHDALRLALDVGVADIVPDAAAAGRTALLRTLGVPPTRAGVTRLDYLNWAGSCWKMIVTSQAERLDTLLTCWSVAAGERISDVSLLADTDGNVVADAAPGVPAAQTRARVDTLLVAAGAVCRAVGVTYTLGPAVGRDTLHARQAGAPALVPRHPRRRGVRPAGVRLAWIYCLHWFYSCKTKTATLLSNLHESCLFFSTNESLDNDNIRNVFSSFKVLHDGKYLWEAILASTKINLIIMLQDAKWCNLKLLFMTDI